ncbi:MAG: hypothetical protein KC434_09815 [Anaerolineales bacterium]|nr:hypothetical protein [Anaerolineales bacterium]
MNNSAIREQLHKQIDRLPDELVGQIADFTMFLMTRREIKPLYDEWVHSQWQDLALSQFFRDEDEITYTLDEAKDVYKQ